MAKSKLEVVKDALTATHGMIKAGESLYQLCTENLGEDYGLYQVLSLLKLTQQDLDLRLKLLEDFHG
jgi:hypothetical protein